MDSFGSRGRSGDAAERYLKVWLDEAARTTLDPAMRNGTDCIIREGRLPTSAEVSRYVNQAAPDAVAPLAPR